MKNCRNCGAPASQSTSLHTFVCEFCSTKNVDEDYFKEIAKNSDVAKSNRFIQLGLNAFSSDEFGEAEKHFESSILENDKVPEAWIYLALSKAELITASNFSKNIKGIKDAISRADSIDATSDVVSLGKIAIADSLVKKIKDISGHYFDTADKTFNAFGRDKSAALSSFDDLTSGLSKIEELNVFQVSADFEYSSLLIYGLVKITFYEKHGIPFDKFGSTGRNLLKNLLDIYDRNPELVKQEISEWGLNASKVAKLINESRPSNPIPVQEPASVVKGFLGKFFS
uniref:hypothetical protein n=1 Tax=Polynucleobacter sp. TaxID=2029855 RepID=UPI0040472114